MSDAPQPQTSWLATVSAANKQFERLHNFLERIGKARGDAYAEGWRDSNRRALIVLLTGQRTTIDRCLVELDTMGSDPNQGRLKYREDRPA
jgi:hypothetical protein